MTLCLTAGSIFSMKGRVANCFRSIEVRRARQLEAGLGDVHLKFVPDLLLGAVDDPMDHAFGKFREQAQELPLQRLGPRPFLELDEGALVGRFVDPVIVEEDRLRLQVVDGGAGDRGDLYNLEFLRARHRPPKPRARTRTLLRDVSCMHYPDSELTLFAPISPFHRGRFVRLGHAQKRCSPNNSRSVRGGPW